MWRRRKTVRRRIRSCVGRCPALPKPQSTAQLRIIRKCRGCNCCRAHGAKKDSQITSIDLHTPGNRIDKWGTGKAPTLEYSKDVRTDPALAEPQGGVGGTPEADTLFADIHRDLAAAQAWAVSRIIAARSKIPDRPMGRSLNNNAGYDYNPDTDTDAAAKDYNKWVASALPTGVGGSERNWQIFQQIKQLEGQEGRFTTFDKTLSVGPGFSTSGGQTQQVLGKMFDLAPELEPVAFAAGLIVDASGDMTVVDTEKGWILDGQDAAAYLQTSTSLLSLLVNISQGVQPLNGGGGAGATSSPEQSKQRQALLDAEWQQFLKITLAGMTTLVQSWPLDSAVLAAHAKHAQPGNFPFSFWDSHNNSDLSAMVDAIYDKVGDSAKYICTGKYAAFHTSSTSSGK
jgi:hypothetical protein